MSKHKPNLALPQHLAAQLNEKEWVERAQEQKKIQQEMLHEQIQAQHRMFVDRFVWETSRDIYVGEIMQHSLHVSEEDALRELARDAHKRAEILAQEIGLLMTPKQMEELRQKMEEEQQRANEVDEQRASEPEERTPGPIIID